MTSHDDDILDFDFVDDETRELAPPSSRPTPRQPGGDDVQPGGRGPRRPHFGGAHGLTPLLRLAALVAFAILVVVLLAVWVQGCAGDDEQTTYGDYMAEIGDVGKDSAKIGADLATLLTTPGARAGRAGDAARRPRAAAGARRLSARRTSTRRAP